MKRLPLFFLLIATAAIAQTSSAIHHALSGIKLKEKTDVVGVTYIPRIEDRKPGADVPKPEAFLLQQLTKK